MPLTATITLSSGTPAELAMPNLYQALLASGAVPNPAMAALLHHLSLEGLLEPQGELQRLQSIRNDLRAKYEIAALCLVTPKLRLDGDLQDGEIGPADLTINDLDLICYGFFRQGLPRTHAADQPVIADATAQPAPNGDAVQPAAQHAAGD